MLFFAAGCGRKAAVTPRLLSPEERRAAAVSARAYVPPAKTASVDFNVETTTSGVITMRRILPPGDEKKTSPPTVWALAAAPGGVWAAVSESVAFSAPDGKWRFQLVPDEQCPGAGIAALRAEDGALWVRRASTGKICKFDPVAGRWAEFKNALIDVGKPFAPDASEITVASQGAPDWEGISVFDRAMKERTRFYRTKRISAMLTATGEFIAGVDQGLVRIDRKSGRQTYILPWDYHGGPVIRDIAQTEKTIVLATAGGQIGRLGDRMEIGFDTVRAYVEKQDKWHSYSWSDRAALQRDINSGDLPFEMLNLKGGIAALSDGKWTSIAPWKSDNSDVFRLAVSGNRVLFIGSGGLGILDAETLRLLPPPPEIARAFRGCWDITLSNNLLWAACRDGVLSVSVEKLF